jgi:chromate transporter
MDRSPKTIEPANCLSLFTTFLTIGAISFGGGVLGYLYEFVVHKYRWLDEKDFLTALQISQLMPGLVAINMSVVIGSKKQGALGAVVASLGMALPGSAIILVLGMTYLHFSHNPYISAFLIGVAAAVVGFIFNIAMKMSFRRFHYLLDLMFAAATFVTVAIFHASIVFVLLVIAPMAVAFHAHQLRKPLSDHPKE